MNGDRTLGSLFGQLTEDLSMLVRSEIALAKHELKQSAAAAGIAGAMFTGALFSALCGVAFLMVALVLGMALFMPAWLAALIVALVLFAGAVVLAFLGKRRLGSAQFVPTATIESVKADVETLRAELGRGEG